MGTLGYLMWSMFNGGFRKAAGKHLATGEESPRRGKKRKTETTEQRQQRRVMAYAIPVALATWLVLIWKLPTLP
jgi:prepilin peptidase CpaA